jgi:hypothetical protein
MHECQKLVELISAVQTSQDTLDRSRAFAEACGKGICIFGIHCTPLFTLCQEVATSQDVPGFVSNALLMPFINEVHTSVCCLYAVYLISPQAIMCLEKVIVRHERMIDGFTDACVVCSGCCDS